MMRKTRRLPSPAGAPGRRRPAGVHRLARAAMLLVLGAGCARPISVATVVPPRGRIFAHFRAPLVFPPADADLTPTGSRSDTGLHHVQLPFQSRVTFGRVDLEHAVRRAGIERLIWADYEYLSVMGYYERIVIHAYGYPAPDAMGAGGPPLRSGDAM